MIVYFAVQGFQWEDAVGVIGAVVGIAGLVLAVYGMILARRSPGTGRAHQLAHSGADHDPASIDRDFGDRCW